MYVELPIPLDTFAFRITDTDGHRLLSFFVFRLWAIRPRLLPTFLLSFQKPEVLYSGLRPCHGDSKNNRLSNFHAQFLGGGLDIGEPERSENRLGDGNPPLFFNLHTVPVCY